MTAPEMLSERAKRLRAELKKRKVTDARSARDSARCAELLWQCEQILKTWENSETGRSVAYAFLWDLRAVDARLIQCKVILGDMLRREEKAKMASAGKKAPGGNLL